MVGKIKKRFGFVGFFVADSCSTYKRTQEGSIYIGKQLTSLVVKKNKYCRGSFCSPIYFSALGRVQCRISRLLQEWDKRTCRDIKPVGLC